MLLGEHRFRVESINVPGFFPPRNLDMGSGGAGKWAGDQTKFPVPPKKLASIAEETEALINRLGARQQKFWYA